MTQYSNTQQKRNLFVWGVLCGECGGANPLRNTLTPLSRNTDTTYGGTPATASPHVETQTQHAASTYVWVQYVWHTGRQENHMIIRAKESGDCITNK